MSSQNNRISKEEVGRIARLARLQLTEEEIRDAAADLEGVLENFSSIQAVDTSNVSGSEDVTGLQNVVREDAASANNLCDAEDLLDLAPATQDSQVKVQSVL